jgi:Recombinase
MTMIKLVETQINSTPLVSGTYDTLCAPMLLFKACDRCTCGCARKASRCPRMPQHGGGAQHGLAVATYNTVHNILTNPVYAGAYAFGRTMSKVSVEEGCKRVTRGVRRPLVEWDVLLKDPARGLYLPKHLGESVLHEAHCHGQVVGVVKFLVKGSEAAQSPQQQRPSDGDIYKSAGALPQLPWRIS